MLKAAGIELQQLDYLVKVNVDVEK